MRGNPPKFSFDINEGDQRVSSDKLELRLGPPSKEDNAKLHLTTSSSADLMKFQQTSSSMQYAGKNGGSQKRIAPPPSVIGWPPVRSFRKKITASNSSLKLCPDLTTNPKGQEEVKVTELARDKTTNQTKSKDLFVKINMDGVPIGRKVNLRAYNDYESLSSAVDKLFRGLLAAQKDAPFACGSEINLEDVKEITGLLDGNGEYTLVYEDHEGDRVLVGDVPWNMFISTVKRLRVLKRSEISTE